MGCYNRKREDGIRPLCEGGGCPVEDVAPIPAAERVVTGFLRAKTFKRMNDSVQIYEDIISEIGLLQDKDLLFRFEKVWLDYQKSESDRREANRKAKTLLNKRKRR